MPMLDDDEQLDSVGSRFEEEPLYQIYHCGAVVRDVRDQRKEAEEEDDCRF